MQHKDFIKAAKDLNIKAQTKLKVVAVKGDVLKKSIQDAVKGLVDFDFSTLEPATLDVFDELKCEITESEGVNSQEVGEEIQEDLVEEAPKKKAKVIPLKKDSAALINAAIDLIDFLGFSESVIKNFKKLDEEGMVVELQSMAKAINEPYEEKGETVQPNDKPSDFKPETIAAFEANGIVVKWAEVVEKKAKPAKEKKEKAEKKETPVKEKVEKPVKEKKEKAPKEPKEKKYTRINAFCDVMKEKKALTKAEINDAMNGAYGGDPRDQTGNINFMITPLIEFGLVVVEGTGKEITYQVK